MLDGSSDHSVHLGRFQYPTLLDRVWIVQDACRMSPIYVSLSPMNLNPRGAMCSSDRMSILRLYYCLCMIHGKITDRAILKEKLYCKIDDQPDKAIKLYFTTCLLKLKFDWLPYLCLFILERSLWGDPVRNVKAYCRGLAHKTWHWISVMSYFIMLWRDIYFF